MPRVSENAVHKTCFLLQPSTMFALMAMLRLGDLAGARALVELRVPVARERDDRYLETYIGTRITPLLCLAADDPGAGQHQVDAALGRWHNSGFQIQHFWGHYASCQIALYSGEFERARTGMDALWTRLRQSFMWAFHELRVEARALRIRCELRVAEKLPTSRMRGDLAALDRERAPWALAIATALRGCAAARAGDVQGSSSLLREASGKFERAEMPIEAGLCRLRTAQCECDDARSGVVIETLRALGVVAPTRLADALLPVTRG